MGGLAGGALAAYLLGPHFVRRKLPGSGETGLIDAPPLGLFAHNRSSRFRVSGQA